MTLEPIHLIWFGVLAAGMVSILLDRQPSTLKHGAAWWVMSIGLVIPLYIVFVSMATGFPWWVVSLAILAMWIISIAVELYRKSEEEKENIVKLREELK